MILQFNLSSIGTCVQFFAYWSETKLSHGNSNPPLNSFIVNILVDRAESIIKIVSIEKEFIWLQYYISEYSKFANMNEWQPFFQSNQKSILAVRGCIRCKEISNSRAVTERLRFGWNIDKMMAFTFASPVSLFYLNSFQILEYWQPRYCSTLTYALYYWVSLQTKHKTVCPTMDTSV